MKFDFGGYATKYDTLCTDGRVISPGAFEHQDGSKVQLLWGHDKKNISNVIGHVYLEHRDDGVFARGLFNDTKAGRNAKALVKHGDIEAMSIFANRLTQEGNYVKGGNIIEVSLVHSGANPGAKIENISIEHSDDIDEEKAIIHSGETFGFDDLDYDPEDDDDNLEHADEDSTIGEIFDTLTDVQKDMVYAMIGMAADGDLEQSDDEDDEDGNFEDDDDADLEHGGSMKKRKNAFEKDTKDAKKQEGLTLSHSQVSEIMRDASMVGSLRQHMSNLELQHDNKYGIGNVDILFPDAKDVMKMPEFDKRRTEWVSLVLNGTRKFPALKFKSMYADLTQEEARAKGYITGDEKLEEYFELFTRETTGQTVYKKQKMDRDVILDITSFDVIAWLKAEMVIMHDEEVARAILIGDGRAITDPDKIKEDKIRPVYKDDDKYAMHTFLASDVEGIAELEAIAAALDEYKGTGTPTLFTTRATRRKWKFLKNGQQDYRFKTVAEIAAFLDVSKIQDVEVMQNVSREVDGKNYDLVCIILNMADYTVGSEKGGKRTWFQDFDIDFNQEKILVEARMSGALTKIKSAVVVEKEQAAQG